MNLQPRSQHLPASPTRAEGETARSALRLGDRATVLRAMGATLAGDPYYDLAMALSYALNDRERDAFLSGYGRTGGIDTDRLWYFRQLAKFINI